MEEQIEEEIWRSIEGSKPILQFDLKGNFFAEFLNDFTALLTQSLVISPPIIAYSRLSDAERKLSINQGNISSALKGRIKTACGFKWKFKTA